VGCGAPGKSRPCLSISLLTCVLCILVRRSERGAAASPFRRLPRVTWSSAQPQGGQWKQPETPLALGLLDMLMATGRRQSVL